MVNPQILIFSHANKSFLLFIQDKFIKSFALFFNILIQISISPDCQMKNYSMLQGGCRINLQKIPTPLSEQTTFIPSPPKQPSHLSFSNVPPVNAKLIVDSSKFKRKPSSAKPTLSAYIMGNLSSPVNKSPKSIHARKAKEALHKKQSQERTLKANKKIKGDLYVHKKLNKSRTTSIKQHKWAEVSNRLHNQNKKQKSLLSTHYDTGQESRSQTQILSHSFSSNFQNSLKRSKVKKLSKRFQCRKIRTEEPVSLTSSRKFSLDLQVEQPEQYIFCPASMKRNLILATQLEKLDLSPWQTCLLPNLA